MSVSAKQPEISFEFYPPKTPQGVDKLHTTARALSPISPHYFSVTFGAGGSTREGTRQTVLDLKKLTGILCVPHISCMNSTKSDLLTLLKDYQSLGITELVALRGDSPSGSPGPVGELAFANELVAFIREHFSDHFHIRVAAYPEFHPQSPRYQSDLMNFQRKVAAGANSAITQYFYNSDAYYRLIEDCLKRDIYIPIIPGIMPITNYFRLKNFSDRCGAEIPKWLSKRLEAYGDDTESIRQYGLDVVTQLCENLLSQGAPGLHFYTLNNTEPSLAIASYVVHSLK